MRYRDNILNSLKHQQWLVLTVTSAILWHVMTVTGAEQRHVLTMTSTRQWRVGTDSDMSVLTVTCRYWQWHVGTDSDMSVLTVTCRYWQWHVGTDSDMLGLTETGARLVLNNIAIYRLMQYFNACNKYIAHIFDILLYILYCRNSLQYIY